jgi:hypothetical protein
MAKKLTCQEEYYQIISYRTVGDHSQENVMNAHGSFYCIVVVNQPKKIRESILSGPNF